jgi:uncharacterized membrane protein YraQ (UPF0718 family)
MISSGLLFQVDRISSIYTFAWRDIFFVLIVAFLIAFLVSFTSKRKAPLESKNIKKNEIYQPIKIPQIDDVDFERKVSSFLRSTIGYPSLFPEAYTAKEIALYRRSHPLFSTLEKIESYEYQ